MFLIFIGIVTATSHLTSLALQLTLLVSINSDIGVPTLSDKLVH